MNVTKYRFTQSKKEREPVHFIAKCEHGQFPRIGYSNQKVFATQLQNKWKGLNKIQISIYLFTLRQIFSKKHMTRYYTSLLPRIYTSWKTKTFTTPNNEQLTSLETHLLTKTMKKLLFPSLNEFRVFKPQLICFSNFTSNEYLHWIILGWTQKFGHSI